MRNTHDAPANRYINTNWIFLGMSMCVFSVGACECWYLFLGDRNVLVLLGVQLCHLRYTAASHSACVFVCTHAQASHVEQYSVANFIPRQLVFIRGCSTQPLVCGSVCSALAGFSISFGFCHFSVALAFVPTCIWTRSTSHSYS